MGWADFGRALYLNYSNAAGMLAETKLALRKEESADRQVALQEQMHKDQRAYDQAKLVLNEWVEAREQIRRDEELQYKQEFFEWQKGETARADEKRVRDVQSEFATKIKIEEEKERIKNEAAEQERERQAQAREELDASLARVYPNMSPEERRIIVDDQIPERSKSDVLAKAEALEDIRRANDDATEEEVYEIYRKEYEPRTSDEVSKAVQASRDKREAKRMLDDGEIDQDTYNWTLRNIDSQFRGGSGLQSALEQRAGYIRERFKDDPELMQEELDELYLEASIGSKDVTEIQQYTGIIKKYEKGADNRELALMISANHDTTEDKLVAIQDLDFLLEGAPNIEDLDEETLDDVSQYLSKMAITAPGRGEAIKILDAANRKIAKRLPRLYEQYKRLKDLGKDVGKIRQVSDTVVEIAGGFATDSEVGSFQQNMVQLIEEVLRLRTKAVISGGEIRKVESGSPNYGVSYDLSDVLLLSLGRYTALEQARAYAEVLGEVWGEQVARYDLEKDFKIIDELASEIMPTPPGVTEMEAALRDMDIEAGRIKPE